MICRTFMLARGLGRPPRGRARCGLRSAARWRAALACALALLCGGRGARLFAGPPADAVVGQRAAPGASESDLKAAFVYNFAKFTEWPADVMPPDGPVVFCIADDARVADALEELVRGRTLGAHALVVRRVAVTGNVRPCHLLYAAGLDARRTAALLDAVERSAVLTVADFDEFARLGGVANFFAEDGKMRFAINVDSVQRARLQVSSKLLVLARIVRTADGGPR